MVEKYVGVDMILLVFLLLDLVIATSANVVNIIVIQDALGIYKDHKNIREMSNDA